jgi:hypothetical protein
MNNELQEEQSFQNIFIAGIDGKRFDITIKNGRV